MLDFKVYKPLLYVAMAGCLLAIPQGAEAKKIQIASGPVVAGVVQDEQQNWLHLSSSQRPAYVGIHGGTAPITLVRAPDGSVYAYTGKTGNDFVQMLRSGNASIKGPGNNSTAEKIKKNTPVDNATSTLEQDMTAGQQPSTLGVSHEAEEQVPIVSAVAARGEHEGPFDSADYEVGGIYSVLLIDGEEAYLRWADSRNWIAALAARASTDDHAVPTEEIIPMKPENYPTVIFATKGATPEGYSPYGLTVEDQPSLLTAALTTESKPEVKAVKKFRPLELSDYRKILRSKGRKS